MSKRLIVAVGGSSGAIYTKVLFDRLVSLSGQWEKVGVVMSDNARYNWTLELEDKSYEDYPLIFTIKMTSWLHLHPDLRDMMLS